MPIRDSADIVHEALAVCDGLGKPKYLAPLCQFIRALEDPVYAHEVRDEVHNKRQWQLDDATNAAVDCVFCIGHNPE